MNDYIREAFKEYKNSEEYKSLMAAVDFFGEDKELERWDFFIAGFLAGEQREDQAEPDGQCKRDHAKKISGTNTHCPNCYKVLV